MLCVAWSRQTSFAYNRPSRPGLRKIPRGLGLRTFCVMFSTHSADTEDTAEHVAGREGWLPQGVPALAPRRRKTSRTHSSLVAVLMVWGFWCTALATWLQEESSVRG